MNKNKKTPVPQGYSTVCPYLMVESIEEQLVFMKAVFDANTKEQLKDEAGIIQHAEVTMDEITIMMGRARAEWPAVCCWNYVFVTSADEAYAKALRHGATSVMEPGDRFYGYREGGVKDPQGNTWWFAQVLEELTQEEMQARMQKMKK